MQNSAYSPYSNTQTIVLSPLGIKMIATDSIIYMPAPDYEVSIYSKKVKQFCQAPCEVFLKKYGAKGGVKFVEKGDRTGTIAGMKANQFFLSRKDGKATQHLREIWATSELKVEPTLVKILWAMCGAPGGQGVPLKMARILGPGKQQIMLETTKIKKIEVPPKVYTRPVGYKRVADEMQLLINSKEDDFADLLPEETGR